MLRIILLATAMATLTVPTLGCGPVKNPGAKGDKCEFIRKVGQRMRHTCGRGLQCHKNKKVCFKDKQYYDTSK